MVQYSGIHTIFAFLTIAVRASNGFNLSPVPNLILREPKLKTFIPKYQSSYFGFTIVLRESSIIIGAPRAQSTLESQREINGTGSIYKCSLSSGNCAPYIFDDKGNTINKANSHESEKKDGQWLGASMDGGPKDTDKLVVCAPRLVAEVGTEYHLNGICYWTPDTLTDRPKVQKIAPLRLPKNQYKIQSNHWVFYHIFGEQGISAHVTGDNKEILIGAPGILTWHGSLIRYRPEANSTDVPYPQGFYNSYFGYSLYSGTLDSTKPEKIYYAASAPHTNFPFGKVHIFDIDKNISIGATIKNDYTFQGKNYGEYFGYALLIEDINGDKLPDVIVTAPLYSSSGTLDEGAIYVYINKGKLVFELQKKIVSPTIFGGRFGLTVTKLGDINHDGYNDIAVGAPFAENGAVFIYLGSSKGLRETPSQKLTPPVLTVNSWGPAMFGHGLSKGTDIDSNGFNDLAIGAPNAEAVFVYRAYPVVKIIATINSLNRTIKPEQTVFQFNVCYMISTTSHKLQHHDLVIKVNLDPQVRRVALQQTRSGQLAFKETATKQKQCRLLDAMVRFSAGDIYKPIELEIHYDLANPVPNSEVFCDKCAAVDPAEPKVYVEKIRFSTGCKADICIADLRVTSSGLKPTHILGSSKTMSVTYEISNSGETAYLPQINITSSNKMSFAKIPSSCHLHDHVLLCDLYQGQLMTNGSKTNLTIHYDVSCIQGTSMTLIAAVFSTDKELNPTDNEVNDVIALIEFSEIEAIGQPQTPHIYLEHNSNTTQIVNKYEIKSRGPSRVQELEISFEIPIAYKFYNSSVTLPIVDINNITLQGVYDQQVLPVELYQNNTLVLVNPTDTTISPTKIEVNEESTVESVESITDANVRRNRRDVEETTFETDQLQNALHSDQLSKEITTLPINRTIIFSCNNSNTTTCARAVLKVNNFVPENPVVITLKYTVNFKEFSDPWEFFVIATKLDIDKVGDADRKTIEVRQKVEYNVIQRISKDQPPKVPIWVYILAALGGVFILSTMVYGMHKVNFFQRKTKEEMERLIQAQQQPAMDTQLTEGGTQ